MANILLVSVPSCDQEYIRFEEKWDYIEDEYPGINIVKNVLIKNGYTVQVITGNKTVSTISLHILSSIPDILCLSIMQEAASNAFRLINYIRQKGYKNPIVVGGWFIKTAGKIVAEKWPVDLVYMQDIDEDFPNCIKQLLENGRQNKLKVINYQNKDKKVPTLMSELDSKSRKVYRMESSRGCPHGKCSFCTLSALPRTLSKWRPFPFDKVVELMVQVKEKSGVIRFSFCDDDFLGPQAENRAFEFLKALKRRKLSIRFSASISVNAASENVLDILLESGLEQLGIGFESADQDQLNRYCKAQSIEHNFLAAEYIRKRKISLIPGLITFDPFCTPGIIEKNLIFLFEFLGHMELGKLTKRLHLITGSPFEKKVVQAGLSKGTYLAPKYNFLYSETEKLLESFMIYTKHVANLEVISKKNLQIAEQLYALHYKYYKLILKQGEWFKSFEHDLNNIKKSINRVS